MQRLIAQLPLLAARLRLAGIVVDVGQLLAAQDLLLSLSADGAAVSAARLHTFLAPVFCKTPSEQELFYELWQQWLREEPQTSDPAVSQVSPDTPAISGEREQLRSFILRMSPLRWIIAGSCFTIGLFLFVSWLWQAPRPMVALHGVVCDSLGAPVSLAALRLQDDDQNVFPGGSDSLGHFEISYPDNLFDARLVVQAAGFVELSQSLSLPFPGDSLLQLTLIPVRKAQQLIPMPPDELQQLAALNRVLQQINALSDSLSDLAQPAGSQSWYRRYYQPLLLTALLWPLVMLLFWLLMNRYRQRLVLQRRSSDRPPQLDKLQVGVVAGGLFSGTRFHNSVRHLRRHREVPSGRLAAAETVQATIDAGGLFVPVYGHRQLSPEYLVLIDRAGYRDQLARFADQLIDTLRNEQVFVDRYYFDSDARFCFTEEQQGRQVALFELTARYPRHRLLIFSDAAGFFNPLNNRPQTWLDTLAHWEQRALFTPVKSPAWGYREWTLASGGLQVLPAGEAGLHLFVENLLSVAPPQATADLAWRPYPSLLQEHTLRWLQRDPPRPERLQKLMTQLEAWLDREGMDWLAACAAYPELHWELTLFFGSRLQDADGLPLLTEDRLLALTRLPWLRQGYLPDWLRMELLGSISPQREKNIRRELSAMLLTALSTPVGLTLEIASEQPVSAPGMRGMLQSLLRGATPGSPVRDYVFLDFLSGSRPQRLTPLLPRLLRGLFYRRGFRALGIRPWLAAVMALVLAAAGFTLLALLPPEKPQDLPRIPHFERILTVEDFLQNLTARNNTTSLNPQQTYERDAIQNPVALSGSGSAGNSFAIVPSSSSSESRRLTNPFALSNEAFSNYVADYYRRRKSILNTDGLSVGQQVAEMYLQGDEAGLESSFGAVVKSDGSQQLPDGTVQMLFRQYVSWLKDTLAVAAGIDTSLFMLGLPPIYADGTFLPASGRNMLPCPPFCEPFWTPLIRQEYARNAAELSDAARFVQWRERPIYLLLANRAAVPVQLSLTALRTAPNTALGEVAAYSMMKQRNFYDRNGNREGSGYPNNFAINTQASLYVVEDRSAGLQWYTVASPRYYQREIDAYLTSANREGFGGLRDWRIPTTEELMSLVEPKKNNGYHIDGLFQRGNRDIELAWTSDHSAAGAGWLINFQEGYAFTESNDEQGILFLVRTAGAKQTGRISRISQAATTSRLRSSPNNLLTLNEYNVMMKSKGLFDAKHNPGGSEYAGAGLLSERVENGDRYVLDPVSQLLWQQAGSNPLGWDAVAQVIGRLNKSGYAGRRDWRLPTMEELASLLRKNKSDKNRHFDPVFDAKQADLWSADSPGSGKHWIMSYQTGSVVEAANSRPAFARAVSGGNIQSTD